MGRSVEPASRLTVHPRTHGDNDRRGVGRFGRHRFTPVRTGTIESGRPFFRTIAVHPRTHGDNMFRYIWRRCAKGSPPYARGQCRALQGDHRLPRFTPVRTGTISCGHRRRCRSAVHPRTHGDNSGGGGASAVADGSPPYARGQFFEPHPDVVPFRFTPVRTGTISTPLRGLRPPTVHPRTHGDNRMIWPMDS